MKYVHHVPRLADFDYLGPYAYFITCLTYQRKPYFLDYDNFDIVFPILQQSVDAQTRLWVYCFMPDHLHFLIEGHDDFYLPDFMKIFKQKSNFTFKRKYNQVLWRRGYYDRIVRREESYFSIASYILNNPVRKGLVKEYVDYDLSGSLVCNVRELF
jgi:putative transposase